MPAPKYTHPTPDHEIEFITQKDLVNTNWNFPGSFCTKLMILLVGEGNQRGGNKACFNSYNA